mmetsp:Transcript_167633/g.533023  ORF Transcript_167633/g.533023 Transcript_167633/m.533023 type:complete len:948 (+) Transcript_167633:301-3144(+)
MILRDLQSVRGRELLPTYQHVSPEHDDARGVKDNGAEILEELHFARVQVAHPRERDALVGLVEDPALEHAREGNEVGRRAEHRVRHLAREPDVRQVHRQEEQDRQSGEEHVPTARANSVVETDVPRPLQRDGYVEHQCKREIKLNRGHAQGPLLPDAETAGPSDAVEKVPFTVRLQRALDHTHEVAHDVDDREGQQEACRSNRALAIVVQFELEIAGQEHRPQEHLDDIDAQEDDCAKRTFDASVAWRRRVIVVGGRGHDGSDGGAGDGALEDGAVGVAREHVLLDSARLVNAIPLVAGVLASIGSDGLDATGVHHEPLRDIVGFAVDDDPAVGLRDVFPHLGHRQPAVTAAAAGRGGRCRAAAELALIPGAVAALGDEVLLDGAGLVDHVPLVGGVLAQVRDDGLLAPGVDGDPLRDVDDFAVDDDPSIFLRVVFLHLVHRDARRRRRRRHRSRSGRVRLQALDLADELLLRELVEGLLLRVRLLLIGGGLGDLQRRGDAADDEVAQILCRGHVAAGAGCSGTPGQTPGVDRVQKRDARNGPEPREGGICGLARGKKAVNGLALVAQHLARCGPDADDQAAGGGVESRRHQGHEELAARRDGGVEDADAHVPRELPGAAEGLHDLALSVEVHQPLHLLRLILGDDQAEGCLRLAHRVHSLLRRAHLVAEALAAGIDELAARAQDRVREHDLELRVLLSRNDRGCRRELDTLQVLRGAADSLAQPDAVAARALVVGGGVVQKGRCVGGEDRGGRQVARVASCGEHDLALQALGLAILCELDTGDLRASLQQLRDPCVGDDLQAIGLHGGDLLQHVDGRVRDHCAGEVRFRPDRACDLVARCRPHHKLGIHPQDLGQPLHILRPILHQRLALRALHLDQILTIVFHACGRLQGRARRCDACRGLRRVASQVGLLLENSHVASALQELTHHRQTREAASDNDHTPLRHG